MISGLSSLCTTTDLHGGRKTRKAEHHEPITMDPDWIKLT